MSTDRTSPLKPVGTIQPRGTSNALVQKARKEKITTTTNTGVMLSDVQTRLMQPSADNINMGRMEVLKITIRNDKLRMDTGKVADSLIREARSYLQSK